MNYQNLSVKAKLITGIGTPILAMFVVGLITYINLQTMKTTNKWVEHTFKVISVADGIVASAVDMETGLRGYLLAGKEEFLDPYKSGQEKTYQQLADLQTTVSDNPPQVARLQEVESILRNWQENVTEPAIELRRRIGDAKTMNDMSRLVAEARGKVFFDKFRNQIATFIKTEEALLDRRRKEFSTAKNSVLNEMGDITEQIELMNDAEMWVSHTYKVIGKANDILAAAVDMETGMRGYLLAGKEEFLEPFNSGRQRFADLVAELSRTVSDNPSQVQLLNEIQQTISNWQSQVTTPMIDLRREIGDAKTMDDMADLVAEARGKTYFDKFRALMSDFKAIEVDLMSVRQADNERTKNNTEMTIIIGVVVALFIGLLVGIVIIRDLMRVLGSEPAVVHAMTQRVAAGDLTVEFDQTVPDSSLYGAMRVMVAGLRQMFADIQATSLQLATAAEQTLVVAEQTSQSIQTQVRETTQVATAITQMSATVKDVALNVSNAAAASDQVHQQTYEGRNAMTQTVNQMHDLNEDVEKAAQVIQELEKNTSEINTIVEVIKGVAEQTNLLALNAAIEAARAGEQGRGFAVVADEVRTLAERTRNSTEDINLMIEKLQSGVGRAVAVMGESQTKASQVSEQALKTDITLKSIQEAIANINDMNTQISSASEEQSVVVEEINNNVVVVHDMAEQASVGAEQSAATGAELSKMAQTLQSMIKRFKV